MTKFTLVLYILLYYTAFVLIFRVSVDDSGNCLVSNKLQYRLLTGSKRKSAADSVVTNITDSWIDPQVTTIPTEMSANIRTAYDEALYNGEFGLLLNVVPSSILFGMHTNFKLYSSYVIWSRRIPTEDPWYTKSFIYQRDSWFESCYFFILGNSPIWNCWKESEKFTTNRSCDSWG